VNVWLDPPLGWGASTRRRLRREDVALQSLTAEIERLRDIVQPSLVPIGGMARFIGVPCIESARFIAVAVHLATRPVQCALFFWLPRQRRAVCPELDEDSLGAWLVERCAGDVPRDHRLHEIVAETRWANVARRSSFPRLLDDFDGIPGITPGEIDVCRRSHPKLGPNERVWWSPDSGAVGISRIETDGDVRARYEWLSPRVGRYTGVLPY
jgi:hypothetical protein